MQHYQTLFQSLKNALPGHQTEWIVKLRENALEHFLREGFPTMKDEDWKYTSLRKLEKFVEWAKLSEAERAHQVENGGHTSLREALPTLRNTAQSVISKGPVTSRNAVISRKLVIPAQAGIHPSKLITLIFIDGFFSPEHSDALPASVQLIADCMNQQPEILEPFLMDPRLRGDDKLFGDNKLSRDDKLSRDNKLSGDDKPFAYNKPCGGNNAFTALNTAFMQNGAFIRVSKGQELKINLRFLTTQTIEAAYWRNIIVLEENAHATVIESYDGDSENNYLTNTVTEIFLDKSAHLTHYKWQNESQKAFHFGKIYVHQNFEASQFDNHTVSLGGQLSRSDIHVTLKAPKTRCLLNGLYRLSNIQHMDHQTTIDHQTPNASSQELYKGILDEQSHGVFNGKVLVRRDAQKTVSEQRNHNLLLSLDAQIDTKPQLEILADDVKCAHGATVGQLDENAMFYLRSRGLDESVARQILIQAFFTDLLDMMPDEFFKEQVKACL